MKILKKFGIHSLVLCLLLSILVPLLPAKVGAAGDPNYTVTWTDNQPGKFPLKLKSTWISYSETSQGETKGDTITISEKQATSKTASDTIVYAYIKKGSFESNEECSIRLQVTLPNPTTVKVSAYNPPGGVLKPPCKKALLDSMAKTIQADGATADAENEEDDTVNRDPAADTTTDNNPACEGTPLTWIVCPIINGLAETSDFIFDFLVKPLLVGRDLGYTNPTEPLYKVWSSFRVIANILLIIALLVVVFGQSIGGGMVDAYTAKKVIPRVLAVAILINISIYLVVFALDVVNILGAGISNLIYAPFGQNAAFKLQLGSAAGVAGTLGVAGGVALLWVAGGAAIQFVAVFLVLPAALALIGAFATLVIRQGIIIALIVSSPIAFAAYVLPNTEKYFKQWWGLFIKALLVYPIVMLIFTLADVMSALISQSFNGAADVLGDIVALALLIIPLFLIPFAFKLAGGAIGALYGTFSGWGKTGGEFAKGNANDPNSLRNRTRYGVGDKWIQKRERAVANSKDSANPFRRSFGRALNYGNLQATRSRYNKQRSEMLQSQIATGDDTNIRDLFIAQAADGKWYRRMDMQKQADGSLVANAGVSAVYSNAQSGALAHKKAMSLYGGDKSAVQDAMYYEWKKTSFDPDQMANFATQYDQVLAENKFTKGEGVEMGKAVGFRHQAQSLASKHSTWGYNDRTREWGMKVNHLALAKETALNLGTYQLSNQDVTTFDEYTNGYTQMGRVLETQGGADENTVIAKNSLPPELAEYEGSTYAQIEQARTRIARIAESTNPDQRIGGPDRAEARGQDGEVQPAGYGGVSNAPVEVQEAARRLYRTVKPPTPPADET